MFGGLLQQMVGESDESDEERAERLERIAEEHDVEAVTLYEIEREIREVARSVQARKEDQLSDAQESVVSDPQTAQFGGIMDMLGGDVVVDMVGQMAVQNPRLSAELVYSMHKAFDERGLYDDLGVEPIDEE